PGAAVGGRAVSDLVHLRVRTGRSRKAPLRAVERSAVAVHLDPGHRPRDRMFGASRVVWFTFRGWLFAVFCDEVPKQEALWVISSAAAVSIRGVLTVLLDLHVKGHLKVSASRDSTGD